MSDIEELLDEIENEKFWDKPKIKQLVQIRLDDEAKFRDGKRKKTVLWRLCLRTIKNIDPNFPFSASECIKKFQNLLATYKRVKDKNKKSGRNRSSWEYFEMFDKVYGSSHVISPPDDNLFSSLELQHSDPTFPTLLSQRDSSSNDEITDNNNTNVGDENTTPVRKRKTEIILFLEKFDEEEKKRHEEFMTVEKQKLEIEKQKLQVLKDLKNILEN